MLPNPITPVFKVMSASRLKVVYAFEDDAASGYRQPCADDSSMDSALPSQQ
ncbi:Unknown protein sequence [Pseudomonas coronafaciens pv. oryzae]|nr:Unknown protein sequence [Pseudomonas coronafaciens pv. oryzae]